MESEERISLSSLYLGTGEHEEYLLKSLKDKLKNHPSVKINVLLDYMRGTRENREGKSSLKMLRELKNELYDKRVEGAFYHKPGTGFWHGKFLPGPMRECYGVHHMKAYVFDDNLIMSGANLSEDYFTNRQDRAMVIRNCAPMANYFHDMISTISDVSYKLKTNGEVKMDSEIHDPEFQARGFKRQLKEHIIKFKNRHAIKDSTKEKIFRETPLKLKQNIQKKKDVLKTKLPETKQYLMKNFKLGQEYVIDKYEAKKNILSKSDSKGNIYLTPALQLHDIGIHEDENMQKSLFKTIHSKESEGKFHVKWATGYFNLFPEFKSTLT
jgi:hypothetical protein